MSRLVPLLILLGVFPSGCSEASTANDRETCFDASTINDRLAAATGGRAGKDRVAKQALLDLEFFCEGRGLMMVPELIDVYVKLTESRGGRRVINHLVKDQWGFVIHNEAPSGLFRKRDEDFDLAVLGCATCHSGRAAGMFIPGLGNKNIDVLQIGRDVHLVQRWYTKLQLPKRTSAKYKQAQQFALDFARTIDAEELGNLTQGVVPVSIIQTWFYKAAGIAYPSDMNRGATKVPALWGYATKRELGRYADGFGKGSAWLATIELTAGQKHETVRRYLPKVKAAEGIFAALLPPAYPFEKQCAATAPGKTIFDAKCAPCHGTYERDSEGQPIYQQPRFIEIEKVNTDRDRTDAITPDFEALVTSSPLNDEIHYNDLGSGYVAPRLEGIWARFPYLHNASVPSLRALLTDLDDRPDVFSLKDAGEAKRFDRNDVGLKAPTRGSREHKFLQRQASSGARWVYDTSRNGQSNEGHLFGTKLPPADKQALLEYLKCL